MGRSIDLYSYDYDKLKVKILDFCKTEDAELVEKILLICGSKVADRYILLNQELYEDCSCYFNVSTVLEKIFKVDDVFGKVFCAYPNKIADSKELCSSVEMCEIEDTLGIEFEEG